MIMVLASMVARFIPAQGGPIVETITSPSNTFRHNNQLKILQTISHSFQEPATKGKEKEKKKLANSEIKGSEAR